MRARRRRWEGSTSFSALALACLLSLLGEEQTVTFAGATATPRSSAGQLLAGSTAGRQLLRRHSVEQTVVGASEALLLDAHGDGKPWPATSKAVPIASSALPIGGGGVANESGFVPASAAVMTTAGGRLQKKMRAEPSPAAAPSVAAAASARDPPLAAAAAVAAVAAVAEARLGTQPSGLAAGGVSFAAGGNASATARNLSGVDGAWHHAGFSPAAAAASVVPNGSTTAHDASAGSGNGSATNASSHAGAAAAPVSPAAAMQVANDIAVQEVTAAREAAAQARRERQRRLADEMAAARTARWQRPRTLACDLEKVTSSMPGPPQVSRLYVGWNSTGAWQNSSTALLADRLLKALDSMDTIKYCGSFFSFQEFTWCSKAMPKESGPTANLLYRGSYCNTSGNAHLSASDVEAIRRLNTAGDIAGLSYGAPGGQDAWSEIMSNLYLMPTTLYDCDASAHTAANGPFAQDLHGGSSVEQPCESRSCYTVAYESRRACLSDHEYEQDNRSYETLHRGLESRAPLSTHVKLHLADGAEWVVLEQLSKDEGDMAKIRTLDIRAHMTDSAVPLLERRVQTLEALAKHFAVVGSTVQQLFHDEGLDYLQGRDQDPKYAREPQGVYTSAGLPLGDFDVSLVNRRFL
eukprot:TRINITY_DN100621_c0_g1_i1.p1 TRINITY_DN100621_c0_g1~~TRINITY_DN100621_c0_g1_i1.p1  ORF type:complete len:637 (+),score=147.42 TRINITY_DN100621_c0_g1_i1:148-2058(+)